MANTDDQEQIPASDRLSLCNAALGLAGSPSNLTSFSASTESGRACRLYYTSIVASYLRSHDWNFSTRTAPLVHITATEDFRRIPGINETIWLYPEDAIRVFDVYDDNRRRVDFHEDRDRSDNRLLIANGAPTASSETGALYARYSYDSPVVTWTPDFLRGVQYILASELSRHLRPSDSPDSYTRLLDIGTKAIERAMQVNDSSGGSLSTSPDLAVQIQEIALSLSGARNAEGRSGVSTSGEEKFIRDMYDLERQEFLTDGQFPFSRIFVDIYPVIPQPRFDPSGAGFTPYYYEYPSAQNPLRLLDVYVRYTQSEMQRKKWTLVEKGILGKWIVISIGRAFVNRGDVRATAETDLR